jgi:hypothetical protein
MSEKNDPLAKGRELVAKIKAEQAQEEAKPMIDDKNPNAITTVEIQGIKVSAEVAQIYKETAGYGMENVSELSMPQLKVTEGNSKHRLDDGSKPAPGVLYYSPTREGLGSSIKVHLVTVSKGYWARKKDQNGNDVPNGSGMYVTKFNQIVGGVLADSYRPFVMFSAGIRWKAMNDFVKSIRPFTKSKTAPIPMYAFTVELKTLEVGDNYGVEYKIVKNGEYAALVIDPEKLSFLQTQIDLINDMIEPFIAKNEVDRETGEYLSEMEADITPKASEPAAQEAVIVEPSVQETFNAVANPAEDIVSSPADSEAEPPPF